MEKHIEDGSRVGFLHFALVARQETGSPQEGGIVGGTGQAKIHLQQSSQTVHRDALPSLPVEARDAEGGQFGAKVEPTTFGHIQSAIPSQLGIELLDDANLFVFVLRRELDQPGAAGRIRTGADLPGHCVVLHQGLGPGPLR
ncbi:hypothetical protein D9M69_532680 [compost metagenome]